MKTCLILLACLVLQSPVAVMAGQNATIGVSCSIPYVPGLNQPAGNQPVQSIAQSQQIQAQTKTAKNTKTEEFVTETEKKITVAGATVVKTSYLR